MILINKAQEVTGAVQTNQFYTEKDICPYKEGIKLLWIMDDVSHQQLQWLSSDGCIKLQVTVRSRHWILHGIIAGSLESAYWLLRGHIFFDVTSFCCDLILDVRYDIITSKMA